MELFNLLHRDAATEDGGDGEVATVSWVGRGHHVLGIEHLLRELGDGDGAVLLAAASSEWGETGHEEVETWEWN